MKFKPDTYRGRGATLDPDNRYTLYQRETCDDGWESQMALSDRLPTQLYRDNSKRIISYNDSPDVPGDRSVNPYKGCEHGCVYCFARPTHAWLDLTPGLDFESKIFAKPEAATLLIRELSAPRYQCAPIAVGINTDAYQPVERKLGLTRALLEILLMSRHPFTVITKSALIERDIDLLQEAAQHRLVHVIVSVTSLDRALMRNMEPRAVSADKRLAVIQTLQQAGVPVGVLVAPVIPVLTDHEMERILDAARQAGAGFASYILLRLPHELKQMFRDWLTTHYPGKAQHIMNRIMDMRDGKENDARFGHRMRGNGVYADLLSKRFALTCRKLAYGNAPELDCSAFTTRPFDKQLALF